MKRTLTARVVYGVGAVLFATAAALPGAGADVRVVPQPKQIEFPPAAPQPLEPDSVAVVIGERAGEVERYAAESLQRCVRRRFGQEWPVVAEGAPGASRPVVVLLGLRDSHRLLDRLCREWKVPLTREDPGDDGYVIRMAERDGRLTVLVGAGNPRGLVYAQDTLFQLLQPTAAGLALVRADVRDWCAIPWRGRPQSNLDLHLRPGRMDSYSRGRLNFIDLRDSPLPSRGQYGFQPGYPLPEEKVRRVLEEAHRRGIFVFATVNCAVPESKFDAVIDLYRRLLDLGADGIWISIDDPGATFRFGTPLDLIRRVLALARDRGIAGPRIAIVPGKGSYQTVLTETNRTVVQLPGMDRALFFFTPPPSAQTARDAASIGLGTKPGWWHNWPRIEGGFTHGSYGAVSFRKGEKPAYTSLFSLSDGWGEPSYESLAEAARFTDAVMPWGGGGWGAEYTSDVLGWWAWDPQAHDWDAVRRRVYDVVYGPGQVDAVAAFDDMLPALKEFYVLPGRNPSPDEGWPPRLKDPEDRPAVLSRIEEMERLLESVSGAAPAQTLVEPEVLEQSYLEPARATLRAAKTMARLPFPEYWWGDHDARVLTAVRVGNLDLAGTWEQRARERALADLETVRTALSGLRGVDEYVAAWKGRFSVAEVKAATAAPVLDGDLSDDVWKTASSLGALALLDGGGPPRDETEVRMLYTGDTLYIGFVCRESDMGRLRARPAAPDSAVWEDDSVEAFLNPGSLGRPYYQFVVNAAGAVFDGRQLPEHPFDDAWNADWEAKTARSAEGWSAELRIPFTALGLGWHPRGQIWLANFARNDFAGNTDGIFDAAPREMSAWNPAESLHDVSRFKPIRFR